MTPERWQKVKEIFTEAVELPAENRAEYLSEVSNGDDELRREVEKLLASDENAKTIFNSFSIIQPETHKDTIGNYKIIKKIGEGGMGAVYLAERADLKQKVALKIIRHGADSDVILRRFRHEQEILAALEHPNIARLLDVGVNADSVPFLAMEYVEGVDLTTFSHDKNLSVVEKLNLFRKVCEAVAYAHSRLIVHRDLKPSNIIVNSKGEPKLLDFGISKLISETETEEKGTVTSFGMLTPNYASPEQFRGETVSTATDVYSLGVILYELLTDRLPYDVNSRRLDEVAKIVCETNPPRPSEAVISYQSAVISQQSAGNKLTDENKGRTNENQAKTNPKSKIQNPKLLRGDLDNVILKALRKEPERRYSSVEKFSDDIRRHLDGLPVTARPDTFSYRAEKFITRNRAAVLAGLLIFLTLIGGIAATSWQTIRAERQRKIAEQQKALAEKRFAEVRQIANNVIFKYHDAIADLPGATKAREILVADALQYLNNLSQDAGGDATLQRELGTAYVRVGDVQGLVNNPNLGEKAASLESYNKAIALLEPLAQNADDEKLNTQLLDVYARTHDAVMDENVALAREYARKSLALSEKTVAANPTDARQRVFLARGHSLLADSLGTFAERHAEWRKALELAEAVTRDYPDNLLAWRMTESALSRLGVSLHDQARLAAQAGKTDLARQLELESVEYNQRAVETGEKNLLLKPGDPRIGRALAVAKGNKSAAECELGQTDAALKVQLELLAEDEKTVAEDAEDNTAKLDLAESLRTVARTYTMRGDFVNAAKIYQKSLATSDAAIARDANDVFAARQRFLTVLQYGDALFLKKETTAAIENYRAAYEKLASSEANKNAPFTLYAEGLMNYKIGGAQLRNANKATAQTALESFQKAVEIWQQPNVAAAMADQNFSTSTAKESYDDFLESAAAQVAECQRLLAVQS